MDDNITLRLKQLSDLQKDIKDIDKDITLILQSLQWDRKHLLESKKMVTCKYNSNHRIPGDTINKHEEKCLLKSQGYHDEELFLLEPLDPNADTVVKFSADNINDIISYAMNTDPLFKRSSNPVGQCEPGPLSLARLQTTFTADERRALHDAAVSAAPLAQHTHDLDVTGSCGLSAEGGVSGETRLQQLAAARNAHRRRVKHRRAVASYKDELRALIGSQMDLLLEQRNEDKVETSTEKERNSQSGEDGDGYRKNERDDGDKGSRLHRDDYREKRKYENDKRVNDGHDDRRRQYSKDCIKIKQERDVEHDGRRRSREKRTHENGRGHRDKNESREKYNTSSGHNDKCDRRNDKLYVRLKQENDGGRGNSRDGHREKRRRDDDREYRDKNEPREKEKRSHDHTDKYQRYYEGGYRHIKREKDSEYDSRREERNEYRDRGRRRDTDDKRRHRHETTGRGRERSGDRSSSQIYDRGEENVRVKEESAWDGYE
ncbi:U11/U12 small nuclear ribonucleoprotein 48 kDa protein isoform X1 [Danaus plexippus]|uniref:U11/U12 small nuclear ribonucleoprotein 48 kDa protein isoform X1 n=2 Tax=Danaus plexippus TaxID=13037 RepID=UPI002AB2731F|nr:U11/U12 small nuclear ribonucleoprotein 48 kDa protein isoform X1 [Danaus plexippus]